MSKFTSPLSNIKIASPCSSDWGQMYGDERRRFCGECKLNVYNLSGMTRDEAEVLIINNEGRLCVRFFQRADGSVITADCPVGFARVKQRTRAALAATASLIMAIFTGVFFVNLFASPRQAISQLRIPYTSPTPTPLMGAVAIKPEANNNTGSGPSEIKGKVVMGDIASPPQKKTPTKSAKPNTDQM